MKNRNIIFKEAGILFIISVVLLSTIATSGYANDIKVEYTKEFNYSNVEERSDIVWDNDMNYTTSEQAIWDEKINYDVIIADDFMFMEDTTVNGVKWIGGYTQTGYQQGNFDWGIVIYDDDGSGNAPGVISHNYLFKPWEYNIVFLEDDGNSIFYEYSVELTEFLDFQANTKYWIAIFGIGETWPVSIIGLHSTHLLHFAVFGSNAWGWEYWTDTIYDMCFQLTKAEPDLDCIGFLTWTGVKPGSPASGSFLVENIGVSSSELDWEVKEWPTWGTWTFTPSSGTDLKPEDGTVIVEVSVIAPNEKNQNFTGDVKIVNSEDNSDFCTVPALLTTPKNKAFNFYLNILMWLFERFPNMFPILRYILGLI